MPFTFDIEEILPKGKAQFTILSGTLLTGKMTIGDLIGIPTQGGAIVPAKIMFLNANYKMVDEVEAGQSERVHVSVYIKVPNDAIGQAPDCSREAYNAYNLEQMERRRASLPPAIVEPKKSPWWAFWRRS